MKSKGLNKSEIPCTVPPKFWNRVRVLGQTECWPWMGTERIKNSYGQIGFNKTYHLAHVVSFVLSVGDVAEGMCVLHKCDNRKCCNPSHLFLGTKADNNTDRRQKGRDGNHKGTLNGRAKLTAEQVVTIRELAWTKTYEELSDRFGVKPITIAKIVQRKLWPHI